MKAMNLFYTVFWRTLIGSIFAAMNIFKKVCRVSGLTFCGIAVFLFVVGILLSIFGGVIGDIAALFWSGIDTDEGIGIIGFVLPFTAIVPFVPGMILLWVSGYFKERQTT